jgi:hypothetical protein
LKQQFAVSFPVSKSAPATETLCPLDAMANRSIILRLEIFLMTRWFLMVIKNMQRIYTSIFNFKTNTAKIRHYHSEYKQIFKKCLIFVDEMDCNCFAGSGLFPSSNHR